MMLHCSTCGAEVTGNKLECEFCGSYITADIDDKKSSSEQEKEDKFEDIDNINEQDIEQDEE